MNKERCVLIENVEDNEAKRNKISYINLHENTYLLEKGNLKISDIQFEKEKTKSSKFKNFLYKLKHALKFQTIKNKYLIAKYRIRSKLRKLGQRISEIFAVKKSMEAPKTQ
ncbi:hypothetical protein EHP00_397 [Ecytonucleospora hepatopenaei]|uniref:Uncharacterized protein n=1 Tax=Ecytonucleospora hepatopenaei TaxID=646526 RepID=A0A1W0E9F6_9MICR|nr:hypothetical protein EHP00_397 [Ecytonucleospora hepatopenaei]